MLPLQISTNERLQFKFFQQAEMIHNQFEILAELSLPMESFGGSRVCL